MTNKQKKVMTWQGSEGGVKESQKMMTSFMDGPIGCVTIYAYCHFM